MPIDKISIEKLRLNDDSCGEISISTTTKTIVLIMEPFRARARNLLKKAFSDKYLLATNMIIALGLCSLADIIEQHIEHYTSNSITATTIKWDFKRIRNMGLSGCLVEFICHFWYQFLDKRMPEHTIRVVFKKIALDQLICAPIYITAFFVMLGLLEDESAQQIWKDVKTKAARVYMAEWIIWPPAQFINFYWLPPKYRVAYDSFVSLGYDIYTSRVKHYEVNDKYDGDAHPSVFINKIQRSLFSEQGT